MSFHWRIYRLYCPITNQRHTGSFGNNSLFRKDGHSAGFPGACVSGKSAMDWPYDAEEQHEKVKYFVKIIDFPWNEHVDTKSIRFTFGGRGQSMCNKLIDRHDMHCMAVQRQRIFLLQCKDIAFFHPEKRHGFL